MYFVGDFHPLPDGIIKEMMEAYEGEDAPTAEYAAAPEAPNADA